MEERNFFEKGENKKAFVRIGQPIYSFYNNEKMKATDVWDVVFPAEAKNWLEKNYPGCTIREEDNVLVVGIIGENMAQSMASSWNHRN